MHLWLVRRSVKWLLGTGKMSVALAEPWSDTGEMPDVLGWNRRGWSILIECKASRSDFHKDKAKRARTGVRMGQERYYMTQPGILSPDDVPEDYGLLVCHQTRVVRAKNCPRRDTTQVDGEEWSVFTELDHEIQLAEWPIIYHALHKKALRGRAYPIETPQPEISQREGYERTGGCP